jgi:hypothetical protein
MGASVLIGWNGGFPFRQPIYIGVEAATLLMDLVLPLQDRRPPLGEGEGLAAGANGSRHRTVALLSGKVKDLRQVPIAPAAGPPPSSRGR